MGESDRARDSASLLTEPERTCFLPSHTSISSLPQKPALYALYGGRGRGAYVAYVGVGDKLRRRIEQHLVRRDSSVTTGVSATGLNPEHITELCWWEHPSFSDRTALEAAELIAMEILDPALRSRGAVRREAEALREDAAFRKEIAALLSGEPAGRLTIPTLTDALARIDQLEERVSALETRLRRR